MSHIYTCQAIVPFVEREKKEVTLFTFISFVNIDLQPTSIALNKLKESKQME